MIRLFRPWKRKDAHPRLRPVDVEARRREAHRRHQEAFGSPPLSEWERDAMYEAVEAERNN